MNSLLLGLFIFFSFLISTCCQHGEGDHIASLYAAEKADSIKCGYDWTELWSHEVGHSAFVAPPLIADVNADGHLDVVAALFTDSVTVLGAESGTEGVGSDWPVHYTDRSFHASPLQFDVDGDGRLDVLLTSSDAEFFFHSATGQLLENFTLTIPPVYVRRDWFNQVVTISHISVHEFILDDPPGPENTEYVPVDPHVLATPVLADLNSDDQSEELVLPVSYYYNTDDFRLVERLASSYDLSSESLDKFLVSAVVTVNLTSRQILSTVHLDLTQVTSILPGYLLATPTVVDLDSQGGACEVVVATGAGNLHVIESSGAHRPGFPVVTNSLTTQVVVAEVLKDGFLQLVTVDTSGNVACYDRHGNLLWESEVSGPVTSGPQLTDINNDGRVDLLLSTQDGAVHVLQGETGQEVAGWPVQLGVTLSAPPLVTSLSDGYTVDIVTLAEDGNLRLLSGDQRCRTHISVEEATLVQVIAHDLVSQSEGLELLMLTNDGTVLCYGRNSPSVWSRTEGLRSRFSQQDSSDFYGGPNKTGVVVVQPPQGIRDVSSSSFWLQYQIMGIPPTIGEFRIKVYFGRHLLAKTSHPEPGEYFLSVPSWLVPCHGHVTLVMTNQHGQRFYDSLAVRFYEVSHADLRWLLSGPCLAMAVLLLILHGFPAKDLLPVTAPSKTR